MSRARLFSMATEFYLITSNCALPPLEGTFGHYNNEADFDFLKGRRKPIHSQTGETTYLFNTTAFNLEVHYAA